MAEGQYEYQMEDVHISNFGLQIREKLEHVTDQ